MQEIEDALEVAKDWHRRALWVHPFKGKEWEERDFRKTQYVWRLPGIATPIIAKQPNEKTLIFDTYERFMAQ